MTSLKFQTIRSSNRKVPNNWTLWIPHLIAQFLPGDKVPIWRIPPPPLLADTGATVTFSSLLLRLMLVVDVFCSAIGRSLGFLAASETVMETGIVDWWWCQSTGSSQSVLSTWTGFSTSHIVFMYVDIHCICIWLWCTQWPCIPKY